MPDKKTITEELETLQLEEAREQAEDRRQGRLQRAARARAVEMSIKRDRHNQERVQAVCVHRKGGKGTAQIYQGNDHNYALITHTLSHSPDPIVICQRCTKIWEKPVLPKKATTEEKAKYKIDLAEYRRVLSLPTDNEPSGTTLFAFTPIDEAA